MTGTGTSNFSAAKVDAYIRKKTLELGARRYLWRRFVNKERIEQGNGTTWKAVRYLNLDVPLAGLTEGVAPSETDLAVETITATATQYGLTVKITDVLMLTIKSDPMQKAVQKKADVMALLDDKIIGEKALEGANVFYGGTATARSGMSATGGDVLTTTLLRKAEAQLRATDGVKGGAPPVPGVGKHVSLIHDHPVFDVQKDTTWDGAAIRGTSGLGEELKRGVVKEWVDLAFFSSDFLPVFKNISNGMASLAVADNTAVTDSRGLNGLVINAGGVAGSLAASTAHYFKITRRHKKRGYEEDISSILSQSTGAGESGFRLTMPTDTNYVYTTYFGTTSANASLFRVTASLNAAAGATVDITAVPSGTPNPPVEPPRHTTSTTTTVCDVYPTFIFGGDAIAVVDLEDLQSYMVKGPDSGNPLNQFTIVGSKFFEGAIILQDAWLQRIETQSAHSGS